MNRELIMTTLFQRLSSPPLVVNFTADVIGGSVDLAAVSDTAGLRVGMPISGPGVPENATLAQIEPTLALSIPADNDVLAAPLTQGFQTVGRRLRQPEAIADYPAMFMIELGETHPPRRSTDMARVGLGVEIWIYTHFGQDPDAEPASALNALLDAIQTAIDPPPNQSGGYRQNLGLHGIHYCRIEGDLAKDPGFAGGLAGAIIPVVISAAAGIDTHAAA